MLTRTDLAAPDPVASAGAFEASMGDLKGYLRGRVMPSLPIKQDFEQASLTETNLEGTLFAFPPLPWIGARFKFDVREKDGGKVLAKTIDNKFFQRATVFLGTPEMHNYTIQADVLSDGNRRKMSEVGLINQRYLVLLKGNEQKLEVNSNKDRLRIAQDFKWTANTWYRLKARVDTNADGSAVVRAKPRTLFLADEASGIDDEAWEKADTWAHRKLGIGNPYPCQNWFYKSVKGGDIKHPANGHYIRRIIQISAEHSPNVKLARKQIALGRQPTNEILIPGVKSYVDYEKHRLTWDKVRQCIGLDW